MYYMGIESFQPNTIIPVPKILSKSKGIPLFVIFIKRKMLSEKIYDELIQTLKELECFFMAELFCVMNPDLLFKNKEAINPIQIYVYRNGKNEDSKVLYKEEVDVYVKSVMNKLIIKKQFICK